MKRYPHPLDGDAEHCQPCEHFTPYPDQLLGVMGRHGCMAPFDKPRIVSCLGLVSFCENCHRDHHWGGYNACAGAAVGKPCARNHPACAAVRRGNA